MRIPCILLTAYGIPLLDSLRDGNQACAMPHNDTWTTPDHGRIHPHDPSALGTTASVEKSGVSEVDENIREVTPSENRMNNKIAELMESSIEKVTDVANKVGFFAREEELMEAANKPLVPFIDFETFRLTEEFWKLTTGENPMDASRLADLLMLNKALASGPKHVKPDGVIKTLLVLRSPVEVVNVLLLLRKIKGMKDEADELHRWLLVVYKDSPGVVSYAWMRLGLDPEQLFGVLGLLGIKMDDDFTPTFLLEWFKYAELFKKEHSEAFSAYDAVRLMFRKKGAEEVDAFIRGIENIPGLETLVKMLRELHFKASNLDHGLRPGDTASLSYWLAPGKIVDLENANNFARLSQSDGPMRASDLAVVLKDNLDRLQESKYIYYVRPDDQIKALTIYRTPTALVRVIISLYKIENMKSMAVELHRLLYKHYRKNPGEMYRAWMELGLHPKILFETLIVEWDGFYIFPEVQCVYGWLWYTKKFGDKHPNALSEKDTAKLLFHDDAAESLDSFIKMAMKYHGSHRYAQMLRQLYYEVIKKEQVKSLDVREADTGTESYVKSSEIL